MEDVKVSPEADVVETQNQLISMIDEVPATEVTIPYAKQLETTTTPYEIRDHTIKDFLEREVILATGTINATVERGKVVSNVSLPSDYLKHTMISPKIDGFRFISGNFEIRVVLNAQPFQAGIVRLFYFPVYSSMASYNSALDHIMPLSGLTGIDRNFEDKEPLLLEVPYIYPLPAYDLLTKPSDFAHVGLMVYAPISVGDVSYTIYCRYKNVKISMPIDARNPFMIEHIKREYRSLNQQMMSESSEEDIPLHIHRSEAPRRNVFRFKFSFSMLLALVLYLWCMFRNGVRKRRNFARVYQQGGNEESKTGQTWSLSKVLNYTGRVAKDLSGIPLLSSIMSPLSTIADAAGSVAAFFGFSTPRNEQVQTIIRPSLLYGMNNFNRVDTSHQMGLDALNRIDVSKCVFGTDMDEMSFKSLWYVPQYIGHFSVSGTTARETMVYSQEINPLLFRVINASTEDELGVNYMTNLAYIASCFHHWRGSICFNFKIAKTSFHSLRLAIVYRNVETISSDDVFDERTLFNYHSLWDIRESYQQTIRIPYRQAVEWLYTTNNLHNRKASLGYLCVYVQNQLQTGGTAVASIEVIVEAFAGFDFEVSVPRSPFNQYLVRPITVYHDQVGIIYTVEQSDGLEKVYLPWVLDRKALLFDEGEFILPIPGDLKYKLSQKRIKQVKINISDKLKFTFIDEKGIEEERTISPELMWNTKNAFSRDHAYSKLHSVFKLVQNTPMTKRAHDRIVRHLKIYTFDDAIIKFSFLNRLHQVASANVPSSKNKISLGFKHEFKFSMYTRFKGVSDLYFLKDKDILYCTNEHGIKTDSILFSVKVVEITQRIKYTDMIGIDNLKDVTGAYSRLGFINDVTMGESIVSIRQLCSRYTLFSKIPSQHFGTNFLGDQVVFFDPTAMYSFNNQTTDTIAHFAPLFRFWAGELRFKVVLLRNGELAKGMFIVTLQPNNLDSGGPMLRYPKQSVDSLVLFHGEIEGVCEFTVPYYQRTDKIIVGGTKDSLLLSENECQISIGSLTNVDEAFTAVIYRAIGDNFSFGTKLAAPAWLASSF